MKKIITLFMVVILVISSISFSVAADTAKFEIAIDGNVLDIPEQMGKAHIDENGRSLVPARAIIEGLGYIVKWDGDTKTVKILDQSQAEMASLKIGSKIVDLKENNTIEMDTEAVIGEDGRTYVPLRFVSEALGFDIPKDGGYRFENNTHYISIVSPVNEESLSEVKEKYASLSDDIAYFNETILKEEEYFNFSSAGDLIYNNQMALIMRAEKIKIGRTENDKPVLEIGIWKENNPFSTLEVNLCKEIMKYYSANGNEIFEYIDGIIGTNECPDKDKVIKFSNTTVGFGENENTKEADVVIKLDSLMFGPKSIEDIDMHVEGDVMVIDISGIEVPHYKQSSNKISITKIGSVEDCLMGTRARGSSYEDDIEMFNKALDGSTWKLHKDRGSLQWASAEYADPNAPLFVKRDDENRPLVKIRTWDTDGDAEALMPGPVGMTMNVFCEAVKYYSESPEDGEAIYWYVDRAAKERKNIACDTILQFGETKIMFIDPKVYGIDIIFIE